MRVAATVVLYRHDLGDIAAPLAALARWPHGPVLVHVNDDAAGELAARVRPQLPQATVTSSRENHGFAGAQNRLVAAALACGADAVVVHNPDLVLDDAAIPALVAAAEQLPGPALLGPVLELADPRTYAGEGVLDTRGIRWTRSGRHLDDGQGQPLQRRGTGPRRVSGISGACLFLTREAVTTLLERTGELFDEDFVAFREDAELGFRAGLVGVPSVVVPEAHGLHARGNRGTSRGRSSDVDRLGVRNRFLIAFKYGRHRPGGLLGPLLRDVVVVVGVVLRERTSWRGLVEAWRLRSYMREKGRIVLDRAEVSSRDAAFPQVGAH